MGAAKKRGTARYPYDPAEVGRLLDEARATVDGVVILAADQGGQILAVARAQHVRCTSQALIRLIVTLNYLAWPDDTPDSTLLLFEDMPVGTIVPGGMGGGRVIEGIWVHRTLREWGVSEDVAAVLEGAYTTLNVIPARMVAIFSAYRPLVDDPRITLADKVSMVRLLGSREAAANETDRLNSLAEDGYFYFWKEFRLAVRPS